MTNAIATALAVGLLAGTAAAQEKIAGAWEGQTRAGASIVLTLEVKDSVLTGTLVRNDVSSPLKGTVTKDTFTFSATQGEQTVQFAGELVKTELKVWIERQGPESAIVLQRAKNKPPAGKSGE